MEKNDESTFSHKIFLLFFEKGFIAVVIAFVGFYISQQLKEIDQKNSKEIEFLKKEYDLDRQHNEAGNQKKLDQQKFVFDNLLKQSEYQNQKLVDYTNQSFQRQLFADRNFFESHQNELSKLHNEKLEFLKNDLNKNLQNRFLLLENELNSGLEDLRSSNSKENDLNILISERIASAFQKIGEFEYISQNLLDAVQSQNILADEVKEYHRQYGSNGRPASLFGHNEVRQFKKAYEGSRKELTKMLYSNRFWMNDVIWNKVNSYISVTDSILVYSGYKEYKFVLTNITDKSNFNRKKIDSLMLIKENLHLNILTVSDLLDRRKLQKN